MTGKPVASRTSRNSEKSEKSIAGSRNWPHNFHMSPAAVPHMEKVCSILRQIYGGSPTDDLNDLDENNAIRGLLMNVTLQAAVHLGRDYMENLRFTKNQLCETVIPSD